MEDQLRMVRHDLENLPCLQCPDGYHIRTYRKGDEAYWASIMDKAQERWQNIFEKLGFP